MGKIIPMSWLNQMLLILSILCVSLSLVIQEWAGLIPLPIYISISWAIFIIIISIWLSCFLLQLTLKANNPLKIKFFHNWLYRKLANKLKLCKLEKEGECNNECERKMTSQNMNFGQATNEKKTDSVSKTKKLHNKTVKSGANGTSSKRKKNEELNNLVKEINLKCINVWYKSISNEKSFPNETQELLKKLLTKLFYRISLMDKVKLTHKLSNVFLLHLKEYYRALRRVEKGTAPSIEEAFKYLHPGSRSTAALEHMLHQMVTILSEEFLQWELTSSLPCKILLSVLAKRLLLVIETVSSPNWLFQILSDLLQPMPKEIAEVQNKQGAGTLYTKKIISNALSDGIASATAAVIPRPLPKTESSLSAKTTNHDKNSSLTLNDQRPTLHLDNLTKEYRGLWGQSMSELDSEVDEEKISPVYEEPTDFATTIARLRTVLQQKSTVNTPLHVEEKSYVVYEGSQFINLSIPWTEFHTAFDGSQQLLYCIQFDDVEQRGVDLFETTTATVRRQYRDFAQLHASLQEIPELAPIMSDLILPEGGRVELENYLKILTTRLANECPSQLRHFLRPSSSAGKKADAVAPRFDRFLAKTVTGVFNTLKTVVPGFEIEQEEENVPLPTLMPLADIPWRFVENIKSKSLMIELQQLIAERTEYSSVDTAYEAVDSIEGTNDSALLAHWLETAKNSDEEMDELDSHLMLTCIAIDLICELLSGIGSTNTLQQEAVVRWTKLLIGNVSEPILQTAILRVFDYLGNMSLFHNIQNKISEEPITELKEKLLQQLFTKIPIDIKLIFGEDDTLNILKYLLGSYEMKKINLDLNLQIVDVLASQLLISSKKTAIQFLF
ncbi:uncharacterized protein LOC100876919 isoform X2 [Megachile rotundata]|uniref:uncharacterized protein LOC100876919 isoform X2 n=1 Tax=Megachile rotundata TaxID=143995 RepID=UPI000615393B|nr:PREDICTED: uncharacterized protein LOC100876919 isoform X2 [Megachile rotundata]